LIRKDLFYKCRWSWMPFVQIDSITSLLQDCKTKHQLRLSIFESLPFVLHSDNSFTKTSSSWIYRPEVNNWFFFIFWQRFMQLCFLIAFSSSTIFLVSIRLKSGDVLCPILRCLSLLLRPWSSWNSDCTLTERYNQANCDNKHQTLLHIDHKAAERKFRRFSRSTSAKIVVSCTLLPTVPLTLKFNGKKSMLFALLDHWSWISVIKSTTAKYFGL
jgi:hypothetical protein